MGVETEEKEEIVLDGKDMRLGFLVLGFLAYEYLIFFFLNIVLGFYVQLFLILFFKYCVDVENCGSFKSFGFIYIYRLLSQV